MENRAKTWFLILIMVIGVILAISFGIYAYHNGGISETNIINTPKLAEVENQEENATQEFINETITTSSVNSKISPNAIIIEKRYYKECDHLIREVVDIPEDLVNQTEDEVREYYDDWVVEGYSPTEIVIYKEFKGICNEHYVVKDHNGVLGIYTEDSQGLQEWQEDTEIPTQYLPEDDIEEFKVGVKVVGKVNLNSFLENYE